jgi:steroid delta-isomerase-like uncharacterized protein
LAQLWLKSGFEKIPNFSSEFSWRELGEKEESTHKMQFWLSSTRERNRATIQEYYDYFCKGNWDGMLSLMHDKIIHDINQGTREIGREAFQKFLLRMDKSYREQLKNIEIMCGNTPTRLAAEYDVSGVYVNTDPGLPEAFGQRYTLLGGAFFEVNLGKIYRATNYYNLKHWEEIVKNGIGMQ